ncbi:MAG TPA: CocE/NonD family hydrolase [Blastocatellia bacterium]|nr:CocE/NonD family hydrolase [Blastocatellia bacterium]
MSGNPVKPVRLLLLTMAVVAVLLYLPAGLTGHAASPNPADDPPGFNKTEVMIATRDGVRLNTVVYAPKNASGPLPILILRTPYGIGAAPLAGAWGYLKELAADGYIFAFQDIRGRFKSEGQFRMSRPPRDRGNPNAIDESTDTYDTVEWLVKNIPGNNGRAGMLGVSYGGWLTEMALLDPHPALKAASPQASPDDMFIGDDFHHNGAFRLSYGFEYAAELETSKENTAFDFDRYDTYEWYLRLGALSNANDKYFHGKLPTWNDFVDHPNYDEFWKKQRFEPYLNHPVNVPTLNVAGWYDQEDFYGPIRIYDLQEKHDDANKNFLVVGPWNHGGWARGEGRKLGAVDFGSATSEYFREKIQAPFFAYYLKDKGELRQPEAITFQTGSNKWESYDAWPPHSGVANRELYFRSGGGLGFTKPAAGSAEFDSYVSDPAHPVPYRRRPIEPTYYAKGSGWYTWLLEDQRFVEGRPDVATYETEALESPVVVSGDIIAHLFASTTGSDVDWFVKLIDVYPEEYAADPKMGGYELIVADEVFRGRFRQGFEKPQPITPNKVNEYTIDLHTNNHAFLKGHKIMVQVQSTLFPLIDRNPQTFVDNIFKAKASDYKAAEQRIYHGDRYWSHITLPVADR